jgi:hypothetical protein
MLVSGHTSSDFLSRKLTRKTSTVGVHVQPSTGASRTAGMVSTAMAGVVVDVLGTDEVSAASVGVAACWLVDRHAVRRERGTNKLTWTEAAMAMPARAAAERIEVICIVKVLECLDW